MDQVQVNRYKKAEKLSVAILKTAKMAGLGVKDAIAYAQAATEADWKLVAAAAECNPPNPKAPEATIAEVMRMLRDSQIDPFEGLPQIRKRVSA